MGDLRLVGDDEVVAQQRPGREQVVDRHDREVARADPLQRGGLDHAPADLPDVGSPGATVHLRHALGRRRWGEEGEVADRERSRTTASTSIWPRRRPPMMHGGDQGGAERDQPSAREREQRGEGAHRRDRQHREPQEGLALQAHGERDRERGCGNERRCGLVGVAAGALETSEVRGRSGHQEAVDGRYQRSHDEGAQHPDELLTRAHACEHDQEQQGVGHPARQRQQRGAAVLGPRHACQHPAAAA